MIPSYPCGVAVCGPITNHHKLGILTEDYSNISAFDITGFQSEYVNDVDAFDGYEFILHDMENLEI